MKSAHWVILIAWWVFVNEPAMYIDRQTGRTYPGAKWVAKEKFIYRDFCEGRAKELRSRGEQAVCREIPD